MIALATGTIEQLKQRKAAGESIKALALEVGVSWQRLWGILQNPSAAATSTSSAPQPVLEINAGEQRLTERYRPHSLGGLWGQARAVKHLKRFLAKPHSTAFLFEGETGTGKTTAALALAASLGCDMDQQAFGGVHVISSGEQSAEAVRSVMERMHCIPFYGSGWKVVIVNEADRMHVAAETVWLDKLENLPPQTVIIFTTNYSERLNSRLRDRCTRLAFESDAGKIGLDATAMLCSIWRAERGGAPDMTVIARCLESAKEYGNISFRRAVQALALALEEDHG